MDKDNPRQERIQKILEEILPLNQFPRRRGSTVVGNEDKEKQKGFSFVGWDMENPGEQVMYVKDALSFLYFAFSGFQGGTSLSDDDMNGLSWILKGLQNTLASAESRIPYDAQKE